MTAADKSGSNGSSSRSKTTFAQHTLNMLPEHPSRI